MARRGVGRHRSWEPESRGGDPHRRRECGGRGGAAHETVRPGGVGGREHAGAVGLAGRREAVVDVVRGADVTVECLPAVNVPIVNPSSLFVDDRDWI